MVSSNTQATLEQSPIQVLTELNVTWIQWSYENWYFQVDKPLPPILEAFVHPVFRLGLTRKDFQILKFFILFTVLETQTKIKMVWINITFYRLGHCASGKNKLETGDTKPGSRKKEYEISN